MTVKNLFDVIKVLETTERHRTDQDTLESAHYIVLSDTLVSEMLVVLGKLMSKYDAEMNEILLAASKDWRASSET